MSRQELEKELFQVQQRKHEIDNLTRSMEPSSTKVSDGEEMKVNYITEETPKKLEEYDRLVEENTTLNKREKGILMELKKLP
ncbi:hypothetical protein ACFLW0_05250 [Chloroflexota bacterium]